MSKVIDNIEKLRTSKGYTQDKIASVIGVGRTTYNGIKNGNRSLTIEELEKLSAFFNVPISELFDTPRNNEKFRQMYFYILRHFKSGIPKTKLAKLLYLADFSYFYDNLESISGVRYVRRQYGPVADIFFETTEDLYDTGKIYIESLDHAMMIQSSSNPGYELLNDDEKELIDKICEYWKDRRTAEIVNFTHEQKPWMMYRDGEYIQYESIIQEDPNHVFAPIG